MTAAQCRGLSCEIEAKRASHNKMAPQSHGITIDTRGRLKRLVLLIVERNNYLSEVLARVYTCNFIAVHIVTRT